MKKIMAKAIVSALLFLLMVSNGFAKDGDIFSAIEGRWAGSGEVIAGKFKGTKFNCSFAGTAEVVQTGLTLDGSCRVGVFSQAMKAKVVAGPQGYTGAFNDGAKGDGVDIVSGEVSDRHMAFGLNRKQLNGAMFARLSDEDTMAITLSVKVEDELIPVVGVNLKRTNTLTQNIPNK